MDVATIEPRPPLLVAGVSASPSGISAFNQLLAMLPTNTEMSFVFAPQAANGSDRISAQVAANRPRQRVKSAAAGMNLEADFIYIVPPEAPVIVRNGRFAPRRPRQTRHTPLVDDLFRSLAASYGERALGILLSGSGDFGSKGLRTIRAAGGLTIAQEPSSCSESALPQSAIDKGTVDVVLEVTYMAQALSRFSRLLGHHTTKAKHDEGANGNALESAEALSDEEVEALAVALGPDFGVDVRAYKPMALTRRIHRRATLLGFETPREYATHLAGDSVEQRALASELLVSVTEFFREPQAFARLRDQVIDPLVISAGSRDVVRCWVAGCATGEEAYSLGIDLLESLREHGKQLPVRIFATDVDRGSLASARKAVYSASAVRNVPPELLARYFTEQDGSYAVARSVRDLVSFSEHDLTTDPPFSRIDLVSCRNVLIYLRPQAQARVFESLHFALRRDRHLFLGSAESVALDAGRFTTVANEHRIYKKTGVSRPLLLVQAALATRASSRPLGVPMEQLLPPSRPRNDTEGLDPIKAVVTRAVLPPTLVVGPDDRITSMYGEVHRYVHFPEGAVGNFDLASMLVSQVSTRACTSLMRCRRDGRDIVATVAHHEDGSTGPYTRIVVRPLQELAHGTCAISFEDCDEQLAADSGDEVHGAPRPDTTLANELRVTRAELHGAMKELQTLNRQRRELLEQSMAVHEELQSSNEELEATTEELRSVNEELLDVNAQLRDKIVQVQTAHDDLNVLFISTHIPAVFLDRSLRIQRFTPAAREILGVTDAHLGHPIHEVALRPMREGLVEEAEAVMSQLVPRRRELRLTDGRWLTRHVRPYCTEERRIKGVVVTVVDVTAVKESEVRLREADERKDRYLAMLGHELRNPLAAMRAATDLALELSTDEELRSVGEVLDRQTTQMSRLIDGLLDVSRIARGKIDLQQEAFDLVGLVAAVLADHAGKATEQGVTIQPQLPNHALWVWGDPVRMTQVFANLVGNAIKFTPAEGHVLVEVASREQSHQVTMVDTGRGVAPDMLQRIFEPFEQEATHERGRSGGLGLGLSLARSLVSLHGGTIEARSAGHGCGTTVQVCLPAGSAPTTRATASEETRATSRSILIVEDNPDISRMLVRLLTGWSHRVATVETGAEALAWLEEHAADCVLSDVGLPDMSGYQIAQTLRRNPRHANLLLVAVTGYGQDEDRARSRQAGFDAHLTKPVDARALRRAINKRREQSCG